MFNLSRVPRPQFGEPVAPFHRWFAWHPIVTFDGRFSWLRWVYRRRIQLNAHLDGGPVTWWQYARADGYWEASHG